MKKITYSFLALVCAICCTFSLVACNDGDVVSVEQITLNKAELTLTVGSEETLTAAVTPDNATDMTVTWSVAPAGIVTVDNGRITAIAAGTAVITAAAGDKSATCPVTVNATAAVNEVTDERWLQAFSAVNNFTLTTYESEKIDHLSMVDSDKIQVDRSIVTKDDSVYYRYTFISNENKWFRQTITEEDYQRTADGFFQSVTFWKDVKASFTYSAGAYTAAAINIADGVTVTDVKIQFENGNLISIEYTYQQDRTVIDNFGTTTVNLPEIFSIS